MSGKRIAMTLCDTSGSDDFGHLRPLCYPQADVALICFSTVDSTTLSSVKSKWIKEIRSHCPGVPVILVGTKVDQRENPSLVKELKSSGHKMVSRSEGLRMASQCRAMSYIECSSFTQRNIKAAFDEAITAAMELSNKMRYTAQCAGQCTILWVTSSSPHSLALLNSLSSISLNSVLVFSSQVSCTDPFPHIPGCIILHSTQDISLYNYSVCENYNMCRSCIILFYICWLTYPLVQETTTI